MSFHLELHLYTLSLQQNSKHYDPTRQHRHTSVYIVAICIVIFARVGRGYLKYTLMLVVAGRVGAYVRVVVVLRAEAILCHSINGRYIWHMPTFHNHPNTTSVLRHCFIFFLLLWVWCHLSYRFYRTPQVWEKILRQQTTIPANTWRLQPLC